MHLHAYSLFWKMFLTREVVIMDLILQLLLHLMVETWIKSISILSANFESTFKSNQDSKDAKILVPPFIYLCTGLQETSHLVDICRQTIIFEEMSSLAECLRVIRLDQEANVVRIKNRLDPAYNAKLSAGYRDVAINITLASDQTLAMGLEAHVCEVQLILLPMYQLKVSAPHN
jgi:hypothetical protein